MSNPTEAVTSAWINLMRAQQIALRRVERALRQAELPPYGWYDALWELEKAGEGGLRIGQIERQMLIAQSNVSRLIDRLEAADCVVRKPCPQDGRGHHVVITKHGQSVRTAMWPVYASVIQAAVGNHMSDAEAVNIAEILGRIVAGGFG